MPKRAKTSKFEVSEMLVLDKHEQKNRIQPLPIIFCLCYRQHISKEL